MELYTTVAYRSSRLLTLAYSSSFGTSSLLFSRAIRSHIYAIYGLVRIADEIVDTYKGADAGQLLDQLEVEVYAAIKRGYSANPIVQAFCITAQRYHIDKTLIEPFFSSMRIDLAPQQYQEALYKEYIHGSAEVVGLMCLKVFCQGDTAQYDHLKAGASALGSAYQKVNFLRDIKEDYTELGRTYFPGVDFATFDESAKQAIITDIQADFAQARPALLALPTHSRLATVASYVYYTALLEKLTNTSATVIKQHRVRISGWRKLLLFGKVIFYEGWRRS